MTEATTTRERAQAIFLSKAPEGQSQTRIVATQGLNSDSYEKARGQLEKGLDVARLNFSHASREWAHATAQTFRQASQDSGQSITFLADLPGPKARIGELPVESLELEEGQHLTLSAETRPGALSVSHPEILDALEPGQKVFLKDKKIVLKVMDRNQSGLDFQVVQGGTLTPRAGINVPGVALRLPRFPEGDRERLGWAAAIGADMVAVSNVQDADHLRTVRAAAREMGYDPIIVAKPEDIEGLKNLSEIVDEADVVMVPRGDWGSNTDLSRVAELEELTINLCKLRGKPVIDATEMMENLEHTTVPARSDISCVYGAVRWGANATMLSGETAATQAVDPVNAVGQMEQAIASAERMNRALTSAGEGCGFSGGVMMSEGFILGYLAELAKDFQRRQ